MQHAADNRLFFVAKHLENRAAIDERPLADEIVDCLPQGNSASRSALGQALHLALIRAERHSEHVRAYFPAQALCIELRSEIQEDLIRDMCERSPEAPTFTRCGRSRARSATNPPMAGGRSSGLEGRRAGDEQRPLLRRRRRLSCDEVSQSTIGDTRCLQSWKRSVIVFTRTVVANVEVRRIRWNAPC